MAKGVKAGEAYVSLFSDSKALYAGLKAATYRVRKFAQDTNKQIGEIGGSIRGLGLSGLAAGMATLGVGIKAAFDFSSIGTGLAKMGEKLHASTEYLSEMGHAAKMSGTDLATFESGLGSLRQKAQSGDESLIQLGLDPRVMSYMDAEKQFTAVAGRLGQVGNAFHRAALAEKIFGSAGSALLPMINKGAAGIAELRQEARDLGVSMSGESAQSAIAMTSAWNRLTQALSGAMNMMGSALAPVLTEVFNRITPIISGVTGWLKENKALVVTIAKWSGILAGASGALVLLGTGIVGISTVLGGLGTILGVIASTAGLIGSVFAFLLSPVGLLTAGIVGLGAYFLQSTDGMVKATNWLISSFKDLFRFGTETFQGIADAIAVGDLGLAMEVAWSAVKLVWLKGTNWLLDKWYAVKYGLLEVWSSVTYSLAAWFIEATAKIQTAWATVTAGISATWSILIAGLKKGWSGYQNWWQKTMNTMIGDLMKADQAYVDSMNKADDARHDAETKAIDDDLENQLATTGTKLEQQSAEIEANRSGAQTILQENRQRDTDDRTAAHAAALTDMANTENDALAKWRDAVDRAAVKRQEFKDLQQEAKLDPAKIFDGLNLTMPSTGSSRGTFNAFEVGSLGGNVQDKQLQELIAIRRATEANQPVAAVGN